MRKRILSLLLSAVGLFPINAQVVLNALEGESYQLPANIRLSGGEYFLASVYDNNYLPYATPTVAATWATNVNPDSKQDHLVDYQGKITTEGFWVSIPVQATGSGSLEAARFVTEVPAERTQDGRSRLLELSWPKTAYSNTTTSIRAQIKSLGGDLNIKKLDINAGVGKDGKGVELAVLSYPSTASGYQSAYTLRTIAGVPDKYFGDGRPYLYMPVQVTYPNSNYNKTWLNRDTHDKWANIKDPNFNPASVPYTEYTTGGSLDIGDFSKECPTGYRSASLEDFKELYNAAKGNVTWLNNPIPNMMPWYPYTNGMHWWTHYWTGADEVDYHMWAFFVRDVDYWTKTLKERNSTEKLIYGKHYGKYYWGGNQYIESDFVYPYQGAFTVSTNGTIYDYDRCLEWDIPDFDCEEYEVKYKGVAVPIFSQTGGHSPNDLYAYDRWEWNINQPGGYSGGNGFNEGTRDWIEAYRLKNTRRDRCIKE